MELGEVLKDYEIGDIIVYRNLAFAPIFGENVSEPMKTLDEVLGTKGFDAVDQGHQNDIEVTNKLREPVFIPAGATFEGRSQNRAAVYPAVIDAKLTIERFPVHCVDRYCPTRADSPFSRSSAILMASARTGVSQQDTWTSIDVTATSIHMGERESRDFVYVSNQANLEEYSDKLGKPEKGQIGYVAAVRNNGTAFFYSDLFFNDEVYGKLAPRLNESVAAVAR
jgi:hypothetical protein